METSISTAHESPRGTQERSNVHEDRKTARLVRAIQELSLARDLPAIQRVLKVAAREMMSSDGATIVLLEDAQCYYADEDAIAPLWKGRRFPLASCISGWVMQNRRPAVIEDIYADARIPHDAYRPTFVKSLAMVPIRSLEPLGALGSYWAAQRATPATEVALLQALADSASLAIESVQLRDDVHRLARERAADAQRAKDELGRARTAAAQRHA